MVEITEPTIVKRIIELLGLRGRPIVSARNSVYPVVIANADTQPIPTLPPSIPSSTNIRLIRQENTRNGATTTEYTVPTGKRAYFYYVFISTGGAIQAFVYLKNSAATTLITLAGLTAAGTDRQAVPIPIPMEAGDYIESVVGIANTSVGILLWEQDA